MAFQYLRPQNDHEFAQILNQFVTPSIPITTPDRLFGREEELKKISRALLDPGKQIFIIGARGVGKTSLANTAASFYQSSDSEYIKISCAEDTDYKSLVADIAIKAINRSKMIEISNKITKNRSISASMPFLSKLNISSNFGTAKETNVKEKDIIDQINTISDALSILNEIAQLHSENPIIVVDEVDRINKNNIYPLSDIIKGISDQQINIKFIFTAVSRTFDLIFVSHESTRRQLEVIELPILSWDARLKLIEDTLEKFQVTIDKTSAIRIAAISDGFPYYIHFILQKMLWNIFESEDIINEVDIQHYNLALREAVKTLSPEYSSKYNKAINSKILDSELILWSTSIGEWIINSLDEMYEAYKEIAKQIYGHDYEIIEKIKFNSMVRNLTKQNYGQILTNSHSGKRGEYEFTEKIFKGYIRIQAELNSINMKGVDEKGFIKPVIMKWSTIPYARTGYHQSKEPQGYSKRSSSLFN